MLKILVFTMCLWTVACVHASHQQPTLSDYDSLRVDNAKHFPIIKNMHLNWYGHSVKALIGQLGQDLYRKLPPSQQNTLARCLNKIEDKKDHVLSARCLVTARRRYKATVKTKVISNARRKWMPPSSVPRIQLPKSQKWLLKPQKDDKSPSLRTKRAHREFTTAQIRMTTNQQKVMKLAHSSDKSPISKITDLLSVFMTGERSRNTSRPSWSATYKKILDAKTKHRKLETSPAAKTYNLRMYDIVLGRGEPSLTPRERASPFSLLPHAFTSLFQRRAQKPSDIPADTGNTKWLSPRFAPLMPDRMHSPKEVLSPTFFALYEENNETESKSVGNMPSLLKTLGVSASDRDSIIDLIMEASGTRKNTEEALLLLKKLESNGTTGPIYAATSKISNAFKSLEASLTPEQIIERDHKGFTFMERHQIEKLYSDQGIDAASTSFDLDGYSNLTKEERMEALWSRVERIALNISDKAFTRSKRQITWLSVLSPTILGPFMFAPGIGHSVLGPVILSPSIFSPFIISAAVLGPWIMSPGVAEPFILSPYVLGPFILSPLVLAPFILTPYVLSPNILNPYLLSPVILSPSVLSADILSPQMLGGPILSPSVLSPAILTDSYFVVNLLSPTFLS